jgi:pimeloyl-ACP methyl ester carboxylesterase
MDRFARSVAAVMDQLKITRAVLVGHSNGVPTIRQFYRRFPERVEAMVAVDGPLRQTMPRQAAEWMLTTLRRPDYEQFVLQLAERTPAGTLGPEDWNRIKAGIAGTPKHVMLATLEALLDPATWTDDPIAVPLLVVLAAGQPHWSGDYEAFVRRIAPRVEYHVWHGVSHFLMMERPAEFNRLISAFLTTLSPEARGRPMPDRIG